jgi:aspartyl/asparaginyl-tRNA synthetase
MAGHIGRAVWGMGLDRLVAGIVGSNSAQGMDVFPRLSVLCSPV